MSGGAPRLVLCATFAALIAALPVPAPSHAAAPAPDEVGSASSEPCGSEIQLEAMLARDPEMAARRAMVEALVSEAQRKGLAPSQVRLPGASANPIYTIPTVVHIIHTGTGSPEYISDNQVRSQIDAVNRDLQNTLNYTSPANDCRIQLCLVSKDPAGNSNWVGAQGITRHQDGTATLAMDVPASEAAIKAYGYFPSTKYLNVWVVKRITVGGGGGVVGYAYFPGTAPATIDGIVMDYRVMGANNTGWGTFSSLLPTYTEGKVFAHEVGHYLDIYHTFHQSCGGDSVSDTPPEAMNFTGCPSGIPTTVCNNITYNAPIHNFMDYTNDPCRWEFTAGQQTRMFAAISAWRAQLVSTANLLAAGACPPNVAAVITASQKQQCINQTINFSAATCGGSCTYTWSFQGGTPGSSTSQSQAVTFSSPGPHQVTLAVSDGSTTSNAADTVYISACSPITSTCANWVFGNKARLTFASGMPVAVPGNYRNIGPETATQMSNSSGTLLFYTDNDTIWNTNHLPMAGSIPPMRGKSSHTGALVIPRPSSSTDYYLLSVKEWEQRGNTSMPPFAFTTIDMSANGGLGAITALNTAVTLDAGNPPLGLLEGVTAIPKCTGSGSDWWVITCGADSVNTQYDWQRYLYVTSFTNGGAGATQKYATGFTGPRQLSSGFTAWGTVAASRDGSKIAVCRTASGEVHIFDFDRTTGVATLAFNTGDVLANQDVEFSPDGKIIYFTYMTSLLDIFANGYYGLRQMEVVFPYRMRTLRFPAGVTKPLDVQLGPDDKIYVARSGEPSLDVINFPNSFNTNDQNECGYNPNGVPLGAGITVNNNGSLPNTISICSLALPPASFTYTITNCYTVNFKTPNCGSWTWNFGDGSNPVVATSNTVQHIFSNFGTYTVTLTTPNASPTTATQQVTIGALPISIAGPGSACGGPLNYSVIGPSSYTYKWTITGGLPPSAVGNSVFVSWGLGATATIQVTGTDSTTGCTSIATKTVDPCSNCTPPPANMVAWWPLDESAGSVAQEIVNARDGTDVGAPAKVPGPVKNARAFNGTTQYVQASHHAKLNLGTGNFTIDAWIKTSSNPTVQGIVEKRSLSPDLGYALYLKDCQLTLLVGDGTTSTEFVDINSAPLCDGQWHHVAATEDRNNSAAGTTLYVDGAPVMVLPGYAGNFSLDNTEDLLIGAQEPSSSPTSLFAGGIDEVELFTRALSAEEIAKMYGAGAGGKCKELVYSPVAQTFCSAATWVDVTFYLCNYGASAQNYALSFAPSTGLGCTVAGPTTFTILSTNTNGVISNVGPGCQPVVVRIVKPNGMVNGDVSCYTITAVNTSSNVSRVSNARIWSNDSVCPILKSSGLSAVGVGVVVPHTFQIQNSSIAPQVVNVVVGAVGVDQPPLLGGGAVSLNQLPPGTPWIATYVLVPGESTLVHVDAEFVDPAPFIPYDIVLEADVNGDYATDAATAAGMINSEPALDVVAVPPAAAPPPDRFELADTWPNPFHRALSVAFDLPSPAAVKIELYDVSGRRVRSLVEARVGAGRNLRMIDAGGLHSGVYLLRIESQGHVRTRRVVMLKN
jgi:PKD repeat protein